MISTAIFWFRRDLRINDNHGLFMALKAHENVLPIFIFDPEILDKLPKNDARVTFIYNQLKEVNTQLKENCSIQTYHGKPADIFEQITEMYNVEAVYTNHDYEPYAIQRDNTIKALLACKNITFNTFKDQVIFERNEVTKDDGTPYKVYTPYSKKWLKQFDITMSESYDSAQYLNRVCSLETNQWVSLESIGFEACNNNIATYRLDPELIDNYEDYRNIPSIAGTSRLGPHLRFGTVSLRQIVKQAYKRDNVTFLKELIWREFFMQILWHFPHTVTESFKPQYDRIQWRNDRNEFDKWCNGQTGYPLVDAGMRELNQTGFMHNRVRMLVGSFLCKHLLIDWRWGEAYFAEKLHDFELSSM